MLGKYASASVENFHHVAEKASNAVSDKLK